jgi:hypothetical protein
MPINSKIKFNKIEKILTAEIQNPAWSTAFQPMVIEDLLAAIYKVMEPEKKIKFEYYKKGSEIGFAAVPDLSEKKEENNNVL